MIFDPRILLLLLSFIKIQFVPPPTQIGLKSSLSETAQFTQSSSFLPSDDRSSEQSVPCWIHRGRHFEARHFLFVEAKGGDVCKVSCLTYHHCWFSINKNKTPTFSGRSLVEHRKTVCQKTNYIVENLTKSWDCERSAMVWTNSQLFPSPQNGPILTLFHRYCKTIFERKGKICHLLKN